MITVEGWWWSPCLQCRIGVVFVLCYCINVVLHFFLSCFCSISLFCCVMGLLSRLFCVGVRDILSYRYVIMFLLCSCFDMVVIFMTVFCYDILLLCLFCIDAFHAMT